MKKILFFLIISISWSVNAQEKNETWDYPVKRGTEQWNALKTYQERLDACQIPETVIKQLSTKKLAELCLDYPMREGYWGHDDARRKARMMFDDFNGFRELANRSDGAAELVKIYKDYPILTERPDPASKEFQTLLRWSFLKLFLVNDSFISKLKKGELTDLGKVILDKYAGEVENRKFYEISSIEKTLFLASVVLDKQKPILSEERQQVVKNFIQYPSMEKDVLEEISKIIHEEL